MAKSKKVTKAPAGDGAAKGKVLNGNCYCY